MNTSENLIIVGKYPPVISLLEATIYVATSFTLFKNEPLLSFAYKGGYNLFDKDNIWLLRDLNHVEDIIQSTLSDPEKFERIILEYISQTQNLRIPQSTSIDSDSLDIFSKSLVFQSLPYTFEQLYQTGNIKDINLDKLLRVFAKERSSADTIQKENEVWFRDSIKKISVETGIDMDFVTEYELRSLLEKKTASKHIVENSNTRKNGYLLDYNSFRQSNKKMYIVRDSKSRSFVKLSEFCLQNNDDVSDSRLLEFYGKTLGNGFAKSRVYIYKKDVELPVPKSRIIIAEYLDLHDLDKINKSSPEGIIVEKAGITSHVAIHAREMNIPVLIIKDFLKKTENTNISTVELNANDGKVKIVS